MPDVKVVKSHCLAETISGLAEQSFLIAYKYNTLLIVSKKNLPYFVIIPQSTMGQGSLLLWPIGLGGLLLA